MSASRRAGGTDDNIFSKLGRDGSRGLSRKGWSGARMAWFGLAGLAVLGLIGVLAALARENLAVHRQPLQVEARPAAPVVEPEPAGSGFAPLPTTSTPPLQLAAVEEPVVRNMVKAGDQPLPPMVMLKPPAPTAAKPAPPPPAAARSNPPKPALAVPAPKPVPRAAAAPARPLAAATQRPRKVAPSAQPRSEPAVDSDVALLSAIIMQAGRHAAERAQQEAAVQCGTGKKCPTKDEAAAKATD